MQCDNLYVLYCRVVAAAADLNVYVNADAVDDSVDAEDCCYLRSGYNLLLFDTNSVRVRNDQQFLDSRQHYYHHRHRHHAAAAAGSGDFHRYYLGVVGYSYLINRIESNVSNHLD